MHVCYCTWLSGLLPSTNFWSGLEKINMVHDITCLFLFLEFLIRAGIFTYCMYCWLSESILGFDRDYARVCWLWIRVCEFLIRAGIFTYCTWHHTLNSNMGFDRDYARVCWLWSLWIFDPGWDFLIFDVLFNVWIDPGIRSWLCTCMLIVDSGLWIFDPGWKN